ncbi:SHOCT domain-containing protein [Nocardia terpenica]|uniref:SHOCT domain-containing protein n=1 Tax=Nocardia terpenica TaxID=455432 RepID=A0A164P5A0_9NOCA|nr:hypothetical protein [Nocardia terpenica]KZM75138.1 hypothetical protein AWN90_21745 [Nocardia terpenica]NQE93702.1 hypothetical protein [Nocardia terpenica]
MMMWYAHDLSGWGYGLMAVGMMLFWAMLFLGLITAIRYTDSTRRAESSDDAPQHNPTPQQILALRYARGEIDDNEYARRSRTLEAG